MTHIIMYGLTWDEQYQKRFFLFRWPLGFEDLLCFPFIASSFIGLGVLQYFQGDVFHHAFHLGFVIQHVRCSEMRLQVREGFPLLDNRHDVCVGFLNGNLGQPTPPPAPPSSAG